MRTETLPTTRCAAVLLACAVVFLGSEALADGWLVVSVGWSPPTRYVWQGRTVCRGTPGVTVHTWPYSSRSYTTRRTVTYWVIGTTSDRDCDGRSEVWYEYREGYGRPYGAHHRRRAHEAGVRERKRDHCDKRVTRRDRDSKTSRFIVTVGAPAVHRSKADQPKRLPRISGKLHRRSVLTDRREHRTGRDLRSGASRRHTRRSPRASRRRWGRD